MDLEKKDEGSERERKMEEVQLSIFTCVCVLKPRAWKIEENLESRNIKSVFMEPAASPGALIGCCSFIYVDYILHL